jgi:hypothetical protein
MPFLRITASAVIPAPAPVIYSLISDYRQGHPSILPASYFERLTVLEGGEGAGTRIECTMRAFGGRSTFRARITEPEPGRVLVETHEDTGTATTFTVGPVAERTTRVTIETVYRAQGIRGWIETLLVPRYLGKVYSAELRQLAQRAIERR